MAPDAGPANRVFDVFFTSVPFLGSQGRHKGAEATKMMPELPQRVHKLVLKSHTNAVNHCQSLGKMPTKSIHTSTHSRCSTSACTYIIYLNIYIYIYNLFKSIFPTRLLVSQPLHMWKASVLHTPPMTSQCDCRQP